MGLQKQLKDAESALAAKADGSRLLKEEVTEDDIAEVISKWTGEAGFRASFCADLSCVLCCAAYPELCSFVSRFPASQLAQEGFAALSCPISHRVVLDLCLTCV